MDIKLVEKRAVPDFAEMDGDAQEMVADTEIEQEVEAKAGPVVVSQPEPSQDKPAPIKLDDLTIEQLQYLLEQKRFAEADKAAAANTNVKPPAKAPQGMMWVFNRGPQMFEWQYDGIVYQVEGHAMEVFQERVARHGRKRSLLSLDPLNNKAVFQLALYETAGDRNKDIKFGVPLKAVTRHELMDRTSASSLLATGAPTATKPRLIQVDGVREMMARRPDSYVELE